MKETLRTFICIEIEDYLKVKFKEVQEYFKKIDFDVKWVEEKNLHMTLKFLGEVDLERLKEVLSILGKLKFNKFELSFKGCGIFPNFYSPRVLWVGIEKGGEELIKISEILNRELMKLGFKEEKGFSPHLTIGRIKSNKNKEKFLELMKKKAEESFDKMEAKEIILMKSNLIPKGPIYEIIEKFSLF